MSADPALNDCALARVLRWPPGRVLAALREDALHGSLGVAELDRMIALRSLDLAAGELVASVATDRDGRLRAARALCGAAMRVLLTPDAPTLPEALRLLERASRNLDGAGLLWGALAKHAEAMGDPRLPAGERAAAEVAFKACHLALGDPAADSGRSAFSALFGALSAETSTRSLSVGLAFLERALADRQLTPAALEALATAAG